MGPMRTVLIRTSPRDRALVSGRLDVPGTPPAPPFATTAWQAGELTGEWVATAGASGDAVALYVHGRRFQHDEPADVIAARLSAALRMPVLLPRYRLAPAHPFPAALQDVLAAYRELTSRLPASRIVLVGHTAGATLVLSALTELAAGGHPLPAAAVTVSPVTDFTFSGDSITRYDGQDTVAAAELVAMRDAYLGGADPARPPQSPLAADLHGLPPLLMACGQDELLRDDTLRFAERAAAADVDVTVDVYEGMPHNFALLPVEAADELFSRVAGFAAAWLGGGPPSGDARPLAIRRVGWAGYVITTEQGTQVLVDPYLAGAEGFHNGLPESPVTPAELTGCDVVAVTHAGYDHRGQAVEITAAGHATLVCGPALYQDAVSRGVPPGRCALMVSGVEFRVKDVTIRALDARHDSTMRVGGQSVSDQPMSFLVSTAAGTRVLCGGDFSLSADLKTWRELYQPQIAMLGIGGVRIGPVTVTELPPADAATAASWLGVRTVIPVHYRPGDPAPAQLIAELDAAGAGIDVAVLDFGQTWTASNETGEGHH
jgi:acetyl esterase/lipase/L-ascorbate metabolism protein UlaG (beta-lactamase superfamily)